VEGAQCALLTPCVRSATVACFDRLSGLGSVVCNSLRHLACFKGRLKSVVLYGASPMLFSLSVSVHWRPEASFFGEFICAVAGY
jgi:hypothetical protein